MIQVLIALLVIVVVARLILKGYRAEPVLFIAGLVLMRSWDLRITWIISGQMKRLCGS